MLKVFISLRNIVFILQVADKIAESKIKVYSKLRFCFVNLGKIMRPENIYAWHGLDVRQ